MLCLHASFAAAGQFDPTTDKRPKGSEEFFEEAERRVWAVKKNVVVVVSIEFVTNACCVYAVSMQIRPSLMMLFGPANNLMSTPFFRCSMPEY